MQIVDGAFTRETDQDSNDFGKFNRGLKGSGLIVNARMVGNRQLLINELSKLDKDTKVIVVSYLKDIKKQEMLYDEIHEMFS